MKRYTSRLVKKAPSRLVLGILPKNRGRGRRRISTLQARFWAFAQIASKQARFQPFDTPLAQMISVGYPRG